MLLAYFCQYSVDFTLCLVYTTVLQIQMRARRLLLLIKLCTHPSGTTDGLLSHHTGPPYPKNIQCYWEIPKAVSYTLEFGIFVMLGLSGKEGCMQ